MAETLIQQAAHPDSEGEQHSLCQDERAIVQIEDQFYTVPYPDQLGVFCLDEDPFGPKPKPRDIIRCGFILYNSKAVYHVRT